MLFAARVDRDLHIHRGHHSNCFVVSVSTQTSLVPSISKTQLMMMYESILRFVMFVGDGWDRKDQTRDN